MNDREKAIIKRVVVNPLMQDTTWRIAEDGTMEVSPNLYNKAMEMLREVCMEEEFRNER